MFRNVIVAAIAQSNETIQLIGFVIPNILQYQNNLKISFKILMVLSFNYRLIENLIREFPL